MIHTYRTNTMPFTSMPNAPTPANQPDENSPAMQQLLDTITLWVAELGFNDFGISDLDLLSEEQAHRAWLSNNYNASMSWLNDNTDLRLQPDLLVPGSHRVISVRLNYLPENTEQIKQLKKPDQAYVSRYALGRDYHKLMRKRLAKLGKRIEEKALQLQLHPTPNTRPFVDSAPVLERPLAEKSGLGWTGKHTLILNEEQGSWFFLGELFTNIPLPVNSAQQQNKCGSCEACMQICPTDAFPEPYVLDARRCISYLTIEHDGPIPVEFREPMGNRIFGCDDCQIICPWNKIPKHTSEDDFQPRHQLHAIDLVTLFQWDEETFLTRTQGSAIRRTGFENWQRNIAIGLGNANKDIRIVDALETAKDNASAMVLEHIEWALERQRSSTRRKRKIKNANKPKNSPSS